jgi:16S rRNA (cytosine1402-N4)-methyltransferase
MASAHVPVLLEETIEILRPREGLFVDATAGAGGHSEALLLAHPALRLLAIDRDPQSIELCRERLGRFGPRVAFHTGTFSDLDSALSPFGGERPVGILADLGVSSLQLDRAERGFSFRRNGPLDMRMGGGDVTAADIIARASVRELTRIFRDYGEERMAYKVAGKIARAREKAAIETTAELAALVAGVVGSRPGIDPATRVFQALRIEVNQELAELARFLKSAVEKLEAEGRVAILSYHSLEDRLVKDLFRRESAGCRCPKGIPVCVCGGERILRILTRRPIRPSAAEVSSNPRSRSAKLRAAERVAPPA